MNPLDYLPDFQRFSYAHIKPPQSSKLVAWNKAQECERRLALYRWVEQNNHQANPQHLVLLNDALSAFLLSFEAAVQHAKAQYEASKKTPDFDQWLRQQPENNELIKGLRTLRHLEAHVVSSPVAGHITVIPGSTPSFVRRWSLQELQCADIRRLKHAQLKATDLPTWNALVQSGNAPSLMSDALDRLNALILRLESAV